MYKWNFLLALVASVLVATTAMAEDDRVELNSGDSILIDVLDNDGLSDEASITSITDPSGGTAIAADGARAIIYTRNPDFIGIDRFAYEVTDDGSTATFIVVVSVNQPNTGVYQTVATELFKLLVVAILLEQALSVIFNYRWFQYYLDGYGVKTPVALLVSYIFVTVFGLSSVNTIIGSFEGVNIDESDFNSLPGNIATALILAGGSSLVFRLFESFGLRSPISRKDEIESEQARSRFTVSLRKPKDIELADSVLVSVDERIIGSLEPNFSRRAPRWPKFGFPFEPGQRKIELIGTILEKVPQSDGSFKVIESYVSDTKKINVAPGAQVHLDFHFRK